MAGADVLAVIQFLAACATIEPDGSTLLLRRTRPADPGRAASSALLTEEDLLLLADARQARDVGDFETALARYLEAMDRIDDPEVAEEAARLAAALENWAAVDRATARWHELAPEQAAPLQMAVLSAFRQGLPDVAGQRLETMIALQPSNPELWGAAHALLPAADAADTPKPCSIA
jgi:tetratricopeptide (TPR) repeat protein